MKLLCCVTSLLLLPLLSGCFSANGAPNLSLHPVDGVLTIGGKPLVGATVTFVPADGSGADQVAATAVTDEFGEFSLVSTTGKPGAAAGKYRVLVAKFVKPDGSTLGSDELATDFEIKNAVPEIYNNPVQTPLGATVTEGGTSVEFDLKAR
jgi:hypothetical protein